MIKENKIPLSFIFKLNKTNPTILMGDFKPSKQFFQAYDKVVGTLE